MIHGDTCGQTEWLMQIMITLLPAKLYFASSPPIPMANGGLELQLGDVACAKTKASRIFEVLENQHEIDQWMPHDAQPHEAG